MDCKCGLIFVFLLVASVSFVSSAAYPELFDNDGAVVINAHEDNVDSLPVLSLPERPICEDGNAWPNDDGKWVCPPKPNISFSYTIISNFKDSNINRTVVIIGEDNIRQYWIRDGLVNITKIIEQDCIKHNSCFENNSCYIYGYVKNGKYCDSGLFVNQSCIGEFCNYGYQCLTDMCLDGVCINITEKINNQITAKVVETGQDTYGNISVAEKSMFEKFLSWIKDILI